MVGSERTYSTADLAARTGRSSSAIRKDVNQGLLNPVDTIRCSTRGNLLHLFTATEVELYERYLISAGLMVRRIVPTYKERRLLAIRSVERVGIHATAKALRIKVSSLIRNLRNWKRRYGLSPRRNSEQE